MAHTSIAETGAKPGDLVRCIRSTATGHPQRFLPNKKYTVVEELGRLKAYGELTETTKGRTIPHAWSGYGYERELA